MILQFSTVFLVVPEAGVGTIVNPYHNYLPRTRKCLYKTFTSACFAPTRRAPKRRKNSENLTPATQPPPTAPPPSATPTEKPKKKKIRFDEKNIRNTKKSK